MSDTFSFSKFLLCNVNRKINYCLLCAFLLFLLIDIMSRNVRFIRFLLYGSRYNVHVDDVFFASAMIGNSTMPWDFRKINLMENKIEWTNFPREKLGPFIPRISLHFLSFCRNFSHNTDSLLQNLLGNIENSRFQLVAV